MAYLKIDDLQRNKAVTGNMVKKSKFHQNFGF